MRMSLFHQSPMMRNISDWADERQLTSLVIASWDVQSTIHLSLSCTSNDFRGQSFVNSINVNSMNVNSIKSGDSSLAIPSRKIRSFWLPTSPHQGTVEHGEWSRSSTSSCAHFSYSWILILIQGPWSISRQILKRCPCQKYKQCVLITSSWFHVYNSTRSVLLFVACVHILTSGNLFIQAHLSTSSHIKRHEARFTSLIIILHD